MSVTVSVISNDAKTTGQPCPYRFFRHRQVHHRETYEANLAIEADPAVQTYWEGIKGRRKNRGYVSMQSLYQTRMSVRWFLTYLGLPITDHSMHDLIEHKRANPADMTIDDKLLTFSNLNPIMSHRVAATSIKGTFTRNGVHLAPKIENRFTKRTPKISDGILKEIFEAQDSEKQTLMELQAYSGERVQCLSKAISLSQIKMYDDNYATITVEHWQTKARIPHICVIPSRVAQAVLDITEQTGRRSPFPNYASLWKQITKYALDKHGVRLTSHYLRKRFHTLAQKTAMPVNHWDYLMGDSMKEGHEAEIYTLDDDAEIIQEYDRFLAPRLSLSSPKDDFFPDQSPPANDLTSLVKTIETLTNQISNLLLQNAELKQLLTSERDK